MAKQTQFHLFLDGGAAVTIAFPTTATSLGNETTNTNVAVPNTTSTTLLAPNAARKFGLIKNNSGTTVYLSFGGTASSTSFLALLNGETYQMPVDNLGRIFAGAVTVWQNAGGAVNVYAQEF